MFDVWEVACRDPGWKNPVEASDSMVVPRFRMSTVVQRTSLGTHSAAEARWLSTKEKGPKPLASSGGPSATRTTLCSTRSAGKFGMENRRAGRGGDQRRR